MRTEGSAKVLSTIRACDTSLLSEPSLQAGDGRGDNARVTIRVYHKRPLRKMCNFRRLAVFLGVAALLCSPVDAKSRKGERLMHDAREAEARKQWEVALELYEQATLDDPVDAACQLGMRRVR